MTERYNRCIHDTLFWILDRPSRDDGFLDTKVNPITGADYDEQSGFRGPDYTYGWIQGRGLEALTAFARYFQDSEPGLSTRLIQRARPLYDALASLHSRDGHVYFLYDDKMQAVRLSTTGLAPQLPADFIYTYSDAFAAKGLFSAACLFDPDQVRCYQTYLVDVITAIEDHRFQMDESEVLSEVAIQAEAVDFGPRMILLGAAGLLHRNNCSNTTAFADRFISDVIERHLQPKTNLLLNAPGQDVCNIGHAVEFCGFAFEHLLMNSEQNLISRLENILISSLELGMMGPGIALSVSASSGKALSPYYPWWSLPETIRACALGMQLTGSDRLLPYLQQSDAVFFDRYWRPEKRFAYQTRTVDGPVDFVPATPDLDPGYHTGLSLLAAIKSINVMQQSH
ncbi:MAG: hypothetical protein AB8B63_14890 [Granulosicoccus sp.]